LLRVIQVLHHSIGHTYPKAEPESGAEGWHELVAREIAKRSSEIKLECWRPESSADKVHVWSDSYGVIHSIYPSLRLRYGVELSLPLMDALRGKVREDGRVLLHLHGLFNLNTYLLALSFGRRVPIAAHSHEPSDSADQRFLGIRNSLRRFALRKVDRFFLSSEAEARELSDICDVNKTRIAPMPVEMRVFHKMDKRKARMKLGWKPEDRYVVYVGRFEERKGLKYLIDASRMLASRFPNFHLVTVGSGPLANEAAKNTTLVGQVRYGELPTYYNAADICVLPSHRESWGRVVLESLACQTPVIATWTGCVPTLMKEGVGGLFTVPMRDSTALVDRIAQVLHESRRIRIKRGKLEKYGSDNFVKRMLDNYRELADRYY